MHKFLKGNMLAFYGSFRNFMHLIDLKIHFVALSKIMSTSHSSGGFKENGNHFKWGNKIT